MQRLLPPGLRRSFTGLEVGLFVVSLSLVVLLAECYWSDPRAVGAQRGAIAGPAGASTTTVAPGTLQEVNPPQGDELTSPDVTRGETTNPPPATSPPSIGPSPPGTTSAPRTAQPGTSPTPTTRPAPLTSSSRTSPGGTSRESGTRPPPRPTPPPTKSVPPTSPPDNGTTNHTNRERDNLPPSNRAMTTIYFAGPGAPPDDWPFFLGTVELGAKGVAEQIAVTNLLSETPVEVHTVTLRGRNPEDFEIVQDKCTGTTVPRGGYCVVEVVFAPSNACNRTAALVMSGPPGAPITMAGLKGTGVDPANPSGCEPAGNSPLPETSATTTPSSVTATATTVPPSTD